MKKIYFKNKLAAIIIRYSNYKKKDGISFFTKNQFPIQVASMKHKKNHQIKPHIHQKFLRKIYVTSEVLIIQKGELIIEFFNTKKILLKKYLAKKNDIIIFYSGIHGFKVKKNCEFIEVKQGPYLPHLDKKVLV